MADKLEFLKQLRDLQNDYNDQLESAIDLQDKLRLQDEMIVNQKRIQVEQDRLLLEARKETSSLTTAEKNELNQILSEQRNINTEVSREVKTRRQLLNVLKFTVEQFKIGLDYLLASDKIIKSTILNLGMSGAKADFMRQSFEQSVGIVSSLGGSLEDIQAIQQGFADETGRARALMAEIVIDITKIGKGTALGIEGATKLAAQFEYMGVDVKETLGFVQGVVETSELMGVNTTKVLKNINDNFKKLSTFTFVNGTKAFGQMAIDAEKTRVSMSTALDVSETLRGLEQVIELGANLQVMGGEFAKMDPFQWLYMARNEPEKMTNEISKMTKGIYTLRKVVSPDGKTTFEKFISPADRDRLSNVAKSLGIANEEMFEIAQRRLDISIMDKQLAGTGLTKREKEILKGAATMNSETGKFQVMLGGHMRDISKLTKEQANAFQKEQTTLEQRAKEAQTFDEVFKNTVNALKGALLPLLRGVNKTLEWIRPIADWMSKLAGSGWAGMAAAGGILIAGAAAWKGILKVFGNLTTGAANRLTGGIGSRGIQMSGSQMAGRGKLAAGRGTGMLKGGLGIGAAGLGIGAGVGVAAVGIGELADSMSRLSPEQAETLKSIVKSLGWFVVGGALAAAAIMAFAPAGTIAAPALLAFGAAAALVGAGIGIAAMGIGKMAEGLGSMIEKSKDAGPAMLQVGAGIGAISLAMMGFTAGALGLLTFGKTLNIMTKNADGLERVGTAFKNISTVLSGNKEDYIAIQQAVESISKINTKGGGMLADLANMLKKPLKVEFADSKVAVVSDITLNIDGDKFMQKIYKPIAAVQRQVDAKIGYSSGT